MKQICVSKFFQVDKIITVSIYQCLLTIYEDETMDLNTVRHWVMHFNSVNSNERLYSVKPCIAASPEDAHVHQSSYDIW